ASLLPGHTRVQDNSGPFEFFDFAAGSFTRLELYGMGGADRLDLVSLDPGETALSVVILDGDAPQGTDVSNDVIVDRSTTSPPGTSTVHLAGGQGDDDFILDSDGNGLAASGTVDGIGARVSVSNSGFALGDETAGTDRLFIIDTDDGAAGDVSTLTAGSLEGITGSGAAEDILYAAAGGLQEIILFTSGAAAETLNSIGTAAAASAYFIATQGGAEVVNLSAAGSTLLGPGGSLDSFLAQVRLDTG